MKHRISILDTHTGGEPTRIVVDGFPDLGPGPLPERARRFREEFDRYRSAVVNEPRGSDVMVGALRVAPHDPTCHFGVLFFNNVGLLGMCGHGMIGFAAALREWDAGRVGDVRVETPVGVVTVTLHGDGSSSVANVASYRKARAVRVDVPGVGVVTGDVAWGGNWFFLMEGHGQSLELGRVEALTDYSWRVRQAVNAQGYPEVDHVELFGPPAGEGAHSRNFVLCPGKAYDRSPCGTGTSAKLACLAADGKLGPGEPWIQESILGSRFTAHFEWIDRSEGRIAPVIRGTAHVNGTTELILDEADPFCWGIRP